MGYRIRRRTDKSFRLSIFAALGLTLAVIVLVFGNAGAAQVSLTWEAEDGAVGYKIYYGTASDAYTTSIDVGSVTTYALNLADGYTYYLAATSYDTTNLESDFSSEISYTAGATSCSYTLSATSATLAASAGSGSVSVTTQSDCSWTAVAGASWMTITSGASGKGSGTVTYTVTANTGASRIAASTVAGKTYTVTQNGVTSYTITASAGTGGAISPSGSVSVTGGSSKTFTITPSTGYAVNSVTVDGTSVGAVTSYTFSNVTANHTIAATFKANASSYTITASAGTGGAISPSGSVSVAAGGSTTFTITPKTGYAVGSVTVDGTSVGAVASYTFSNVKAAHTIAATFVQAFTINASAGINGSISPSGKSSVPSGKSITFTITPKAGYKIRYLAVDGRFVTVSSSYTFSSVTKNHSIRAYFGAL